jgi:hypothetical protein
MDDKPKEAGPLSMRLKTLRCRRTGQMFDVPTHARCPYCFADEDTIAKGGQYEDFCGFDPEKDPINFGFRHDSTRNENG